MNLGFSRADKRATTITANRQPASAKIYSGLTAGERKAVVQTTAKSLLFSSLYWIYERRLLHQIQQAAMPGHVAIILDGNRRHARQRRLDDLREIYRCGAEKLDDVLDWCTELGIPALTLWVFSTENLKRSPVEISGILAAIEAKIASLALDPLVHQRRIRVRAIGRLDILPESVAAAIRAAEIATAKYSSMTLTVAAAYGGREEIVDAVRTLLKAHGQQSVSSPEVMESITPEAIARHLYAADLPDPDLIIRTSGEVRMSGFLLWQSVHSEFYFTDALWPSFRKIDFLRAIRAYQARIRRFGR